MTEILIVCGALAALVAVVAGIVVGTKFSSTRRHRPAGPDPMTKYIGLLATHPEMAGMEDQIVYLAKAQLGSSHSFHQPPLEIRRNLSLDLGSVDHSGGVARPASNVVAFSRSKGPAHNPRAIADFGRVCDQVGLELRKDEDDRRRPPSTDPASG